MERPRRNRRSDAIRASLREAYLSPAHMVYPVFVQEGHGKIDPIKSMPGQSRLSLDELLKVCETASSLGVAGIALFPVVPEGKKNSLGDESWNPQGLVPECVRAIKKKFPNLLVVTDVALDPYSSDGHDGIVRDGLILNDETVEVLCKQAVMQAEAGADFVAPSDMMDGRIGAIRKALDAKGFTHTGIISYCAKYASSFYGPFREALDSAPRFGDKKTYQMDPANRREALREARLDTAEGADLLMVKPALAYLDVIRDLREFSDLPIAAYQVSGEFAMIKAAALNNWIDGDKVMLESLLSIRRAGADLIFTYAAIEASKLLK
ncbi:MAG: porphobilinogen synthase [Bdellovibrionaceae bacterium]|nr:porphobilinogen synthase [Pseudobdellovibrionaceae bacterium]